MREPASFFAGGLVMAFCIAFAPRHWGLVRVLIVSGAVLALCAVTL